MNLLHREHGCLGRKGYTPRKRGASAFERLESRQLLAADCIASGAVTDADVICHDEAGAYFLHSSVTDLSKPVESALIESEYRHLTPIRVEDAPIYESLPDADQKIYLDFDGHSVSRTGWNEYNNGRTIAASAFDRDGDPTTFDGAEQRAIELIWSRVAEDFAPFDIDVTTRSPSARDFGEGKKAIRVLVSSNVDQLSGERWFENVGGVGYVGSWRFNSDTPVWVFGNVLRGHEKRIAEAVSHELGHAFGLDHDGTHEEEYFSGFGTGETSWGPIMGASSGRSVTQWSQGEYDDASNVENDLEIIASAVNEINFREDDHTSTLFAPTEIETTDLGTFRVEGIISTPYDRDFFVIEMDSGLLELTAHGAEIGANVDLQLTLYDPEVNILGTFDPRDDLSASVRAELPAGKYFVRVDGVGQGDPKLGGYSEYGSVGTYILAGSFPHGEVQSSQEPAAIPTTATNDEPDLGPFGFADFLSLRLAYGQQVTTDHDSDLNSDNKVDFKDFLIFAKHYG